MANMLVLQDYHHGGMYPYGFSSANYALYAIFLIDYLFSFRKSKRNKTNIILGACLIAVLYVCMCYDGITSTGLKFKPYPVDFIENSWHWSGFFTGILTGLLIQIVGLNIESRTKNVKTIIVKDEKAIETNKVDKKR